MASTNLFIMQRTLLLVATFLARCARSVTNDNKARVFQERSLLEKKGEKTVEYFWEYVAL